MGEATQGKAQGRILDLGEGRWGDHTVVDSVLQKVLEAAMGDWLIKEDQ